MAGESNELALSLHLLQSHGADLTIKDNNGNTLLHYLARIDGNLSLLAGLLLVDENKPDLLSVNKFGQTVLHALCGSHGSIPRNDDDITDINTAVELLLVNGVNIHVMGTRRCIIWR